MYPDILPIWQPQGSSTHIVASQVAQKFGVKTSHTGTLDPMAEGVIIVLLGDARLKKYEYAAWPKTYEFDLVFGTATDTYDALGLTTHVDFSVAVLKENVEKAIKPLLGTYTQEVPIYSTIKVNGKHLHQLARSQITVALPNRKGTIFEISLLDFKKTILFDLVLDIKSKIKI